MPGRLRSLVLLAGGVAVGVTVAVGADRFFGGDEPPVTAASRSADVDPTSLLDPSRLSEVDGPRERADSPRAAVEQFLAAELAGDGERSFALLADNVRLDYGSVAAWEADPDAFPTVTGYEVLTDPDAAGERVTVETVTRYRSSLDSVAGLVPARARTAWAAVREDGGWAVDLYETVETPQLPPDDDAVAAARSWVQQQQGCPEPPPAVAGSAALARSLCGTAGQVAVGDAAPLPAVDAGALQSTFGGEVSTWARVVPVTSPVGLRAVLAPVGDSWSVVAVLAPNTARAP